jgi:hypothetical protein
LLAHGLWVFPAGGSSANVGNPDILIYPGEAMKTTFPDNVLIAGAHKGTTREQADAINAEIGATVLYEPTLSNSYGIRLPDGWSWRRPRRLTRARIGKTAPPMADALDLLGVTNPRRETIRSPPRCA